MQCWLENHLSDKLKRTRIFGEVVKTEIPIKETSKVYELCVTPKGFVKETIVDWANDVFYLWEASMVTWQQYDLRGTRRHPEH